MTSLTDVVLAVAETGWCVVPEFLAMEPAMALQEEAVCLDQSGAFQPAGVGRGRGQVFRADVRGDRILWLDPQALTPAQAVYWTAVDSLRQAFNERLFLGLVELEAHLAIYPARAVYQKHVDRFSDADERTISLSLYLNHAWQVEDGGQLRLHGPNGVVEVVPVLGTLVVFRSDTVPHEVVPAMRDRFSLTGWLKRRVSGRLPP